MLLAPACNDTSSECAGSFLLSDGGANGYSETKAASGIAGFNELTCVLIAMGAWEELRMWHKRRADLGLKLPRSHKVLC